MNDVQLTAQAVPFAREWLTRLPARAGTDDQIAEVIQQSFELHRRWGKQRPWWTKYDAHQFDAVQVKRGDVSEILQMAAIRLPGGNWLIGSTEEFQASRKYVSERLMDTFKAVLAEREHRGAARWTRPLRIAVRLAALIACIQFVACPLSAEPAASWIEDATPAIKRFVSASGYEVSFPVSWRVLQRDGFELFIDLIGAPGEAATLSFDSRNVAPKARGGVEAMLTGDGNGLAESMLPQMRRRFPDVKVLRSGPTVLGNAPAVEMVSEYTLRNPGSETRIVGWLIMCYRNGRLYRVQFEAAGEDRKRRMEEAAHILAFFMFR